MYLVRCICVQMTFQESWEEKFEVGSPCRRDIWMLANMVSKYLFIDKNQNFDLSGQSWPISVCIWRWLCVNRELVSWSLLAIGLWRYGKCLVSSIPVYVYRARQNIDFEGILALINRCYICVPLHMRSIPGCYSSGLQKRLHSCIHFDSRFRANNPDRNASSHFINPTHNRK